jgi:hypothetical protein
MLFFARLLYFKIKPTLKQDIKFEASTHIPHFSLPSCILIFDLVVQRAGLAPLPSPNCHVIIYHTVCR